MSSARSAEEAADRVAGEGPTQSPAAGGHTTPYTETVYAAGWLALILADFDGHHGDGGWWIVMAIGMVLFWGLLILALIWLVRELTGRRGIGSRQSPLDLLDRRLAEGTISPEDYHERRAILTGSQSTGDTDPPA